MKVSEKGLSPSSRCWGSSGWRQLEVKAPDKQGLRPRPPSLLPAWLFGEEKAEQG